MRLSLDKKFEQEIRDLDLNFLEEETVYALKNYIDAKIAQVKQEILKEQKCPKKQ